MQDQTLASSSAASAEDPLARMGLAGETLCVTSFLTCQGFNAALVTLVKNPVLRQKGGMVRILSVSDPDSLPEALAALGRGEAVAIPTETVYGLAADATNPAAITAIYQAKERPRFNPLICHMADLAMAKTHADFDPVSLKLAEAFWPGPLTLVLPLKPESGIHDLATAGLSTVGVRVPTGFASRLIAAFGKPLAAPSANRSGRISTTDAHAVAEDLEGRISLVLDGGPSPVGVESTILKVEGGRIRLLRPGGLAVNAIEAVAGMKVDRDDAHQRAIEAPGMLASHYAPDAAVLLDVSAVRPGDVLITFGAQTIRGAETARAVFNLSPAGDLAEAAASLFATMKTADRLGAPALAFAPIPNHDLGEAINDRLARAAAPRS